MVGGAQPQQKPNIPQWLQGLQLGAQVAQMGSAPRPRHPSSADVGSDADAREPYGRHGHVARNALGRRAGLGRHGVSG